MLLVPLALADDTWFADGVRVSYADVLAEGVAKGRTGRVLVAADRAPTGPDVATVVQLKGGLWRVTPRGDDLALARRLHATPGVRYAVPDLIWRLEPASVPDDPLLPDEWHLENTGQGGRDVDVDIDATLAWEYATGAGRLIAVLDSGVETAHPDLSVVAGHDYIGDDDDPNPSDDSSAPHGTGVAGIAAATGDNGYGVAGVAWGADVYAIRLIGGDTTTEDLYDAFVEAVDAGADVLSNSWGLGTGCTTSSSDVFRDMFQYAEDYGRGGLGAAVVFAAGNSGCDITGDGMLSYRSIVVVAALESNDTRAWYSNYGEPVDIAAPTGILTTDIVSGGYGSYGGDDAFADGFSGTSGATPVVSGVIALMFEANPRLTAKDAREVLCETAVRVDASLQAYDSDGWSPYYGCGRIDAGAAVAAVANTEPAAPVPTLTSETAEAPRVVLAWEPAVDPDGDVLSYTVRWNDGEDHEESVVGTSVAIGDAVEVGDVVTWTVAAVDPWGEGPESEPLTLEVVAMPEAAEPKEEEGGCATAAGPSWLGLLALLGARRR